ncbi:M15 family metallopeptidase [Paenibacillus sp. BR2-3]|uniref:M15 family metallopeptidase n=1 Tax=Paenibacillus sp. BR2-3 TaxID=3048494 RepID=UPI00397775C7
MMLKLWPRKLACLLLSISVLTGVGLSAGSPVMAKSTPEKETVKKYPFPKAFVYLNEIIPSVYYDIRYYGENNFVGARIDGYKAPLAIMTRKAAVSLKAVSNELEKKGYSLRIHDAYRPQKAVSHFVRWSKDASDVKTRKEYYPSLDKRNLFKLGFIATKSGHSRGSTVDLTLVYKKTGKIVDMGSPLDFFGDISYYDTSLITKAQKANRKLLRDAMVKQGFKPYSKEWWHFSLIKEPFPNQYFNFNVE